MSSDGATLYTLISPCIECAKMIIQSGIKRVVYSDTYRKVDGLELLEKAGVETLEIRNTVRTMDWRIELKKEDVHGIYL